MSAEKSYRGVQTREVWDFRLSTASPVLHNSGKTWRIDIHPLVDGTGTPLESIETDIPVEKGEKGLIKGQAACFAILRTMRDKYSHPDIEELKPVAAAINAKADSISALLEGKSRAEAMEFLSGNFEKAVAELETELGEQS